jgi:hypothetical protein
MNKAELIKKIAVLESINDQLYSEIVDVDRLMRLVGFEGGRETVKLTAQEIYKCEHEDEEAA